MKAFRITGIAVCSMLLLAACGQKKQDANGSVAPDPNAKPLVELARVATEPVAQLQVYSATIVGEIKNNIAPSTPGRISKIKVEVGDNVKKGQILVEMDETTLSQQEMQLKNLETEFNRTYVIYNIYPDPDIKLIDIFKGSETHVILAVVFSLLIVLPAIYQLHLWMRRAEE